MAERLAGKVAIVTGGASGIGAETSRCLAAEGARVIVADLDEALGGKVASEIGSNAAFVRHDVADEASWESIVAETLREHGGLHVLVNNAGILFRGDVEETPLEDWRRVQAVNADGVFLGCKHAIPAMRASGPASIVNVSSLAALRGTPVYAAYSASKGAVRSLSKTVALHCAARGDAIRCNSIHPGGVSTPMVHDSMKQSGVEIDVEAIRRSADLARSMGLGQPRDIANLMVFLASDESIYVNGAEIEIDGGLAASTATSLRSAPE
jgi:3(or 17)beta-hydroxysteroid dehydrogenase